jgi:hypothetical protein
MPLWSTVRRRAATSPSFVRLTRAAEESPTLATHSWSPCTRARVQVVPHSSSLSQPCRGQHSTARHRVANEHGWEHSAVYSVVYRTNHRMTWCMQRVNGAETRTRTTWITRLQCYFATATSTAAVTAPARAPTQQHSSPPAQMPYSKVVHWACTVCTSSYSCA